VTAPTLAKAVDEFARSAPACAGRFAYLGQDLRSVLDRAEEQATRLKDEFVSVEHLLIALADPAHASAAQRALAKAGVSGDALLKSLATVRGGSG
jgi:ATP-dependent Clp protease ATP-binding subunit ClpB